MEHERQRLSLNQLIRKANKAWHGVRLGQPDWSDSSHSLAFTAESRSGKLLFHVILNAYWEPLEFELPQAAQLSGDTWRRWIDTSLDSPHDIEVWQAAPVVADRIFKASPRSVVVLYARADNRAPSDLPVRT